MQSRQLLLTAAAAFIAAGTATSAFAASIQVGKSGKTFTSSAVQCSAHPDTGVTAPMVQAGLYNPKASASATVALNGTRLKTVVATDPVADVWLADGNNTVVVALNKRLADTYAFAVTPGQCSLPDTSGNTFSADGTLEYAASGKSYATVTPGCAQNPGTGQLQPYVNLFDNGGYLLNVSVNNIPLTQLSAQRPHTPVFLRAGVNVISAANGSLSTDYYIRDGGNGQCAL